MVIEAIHSPGAEAVGQPADELSRLSDILLARGALDNRTLDRARRVAADTGGRLDRVLTQLGMVSEREPSEEDTERLKDLASEAPVIRLVNQLIARAVETGASDVHIEPFEDRLRIRYRYDGALHEAEPPPARLRAAVISRVKIMS